MTNIEDSITTFGLYRMGSSFDKPAGVLPGFFASKSYYGGDASQRSKWRTLAFHGLGTLSVNVYVDNLLILKDQVVVMAETPDQQRLINLPRSKSTGYMLRYEYTIHSGHVRFCEIFYEQMGSDVN